MGIACYIRHAEDPQATGIAVTIIDNWQGRRLGNELLTRLLGRARQAGIHHFTALVADDNTAMAGLLRNMSANLVGRSPGTVEYEITPTPPGKTRPHQPRASSRTVFELRAEPPGSGRESGIGVPRRDHRDPAKDRWPAACPGLIPGQPVK